VHCAPRNRPTAYRNGSAVVDQDRREALHPPEQRDVINADAPFAEEFFEITIRQPETRTSAPRA
jgi:hypothetical protein